MAQGNHADGESVVASLKDLAGDLGVLLRQDLESARAEMVDKAKAAGMGAGLLSGSVLTGLLTLFSLTVLVMVGLSGVMQLWIAALVVTLFWGVVTAVLAVSGKRKIGEAGPPVPEVAIAHLKADIRAAQDGIAEAKDA